jgi:hypothetical protein
MISTRHSRSTSYAQLHWPVLKGTCSPRSISLLRDIMTLLRFLLALITLPMAPGWRSRRYVEPRSLWLQGLSREQLHERLGRFFIAPRMNQDHRLATKEEFKAEFDRILRSGADHERRSLGVLVNPLFGFTPRDRPVFLRVLAMQYLLYNQIASRSSRTLFEDSLIDQVERFIRRYQRHRP